MRNVREETEFRNRVGCGVEMACALVGAYANTYWKGIEAGKSRTAASQAAEKACSDKAAYIMKEAR